MGQFKAVSLFIDISGFTALTEALMQHRKAGAEALTEAMNGVFSPLVEVVYGHGGFISTFAGDAFTALFPLRRQGAIWRAAQVARFVQEFFAENGRVQTKYGDFTLGVKAGLGLGRVEWGIVGAEGRNAYFFRGPAIENCIAAERLAAQGEIIASSEFAQAAATASRMAAQGGYSLLAPGAAGLPAGRGRRPAALKPEALRPFVLDAVIDLDAPAEFRDVASVFISFDGLEAVSALDAFVSRVLELVASYGGYFNKLDFGDKGGVLLVLFGAPVAHETELERAADFLLALRSQAWQVRWRAGLSFDTVYAGFLGGQERSEYTAIGDAVNLSARLMAAAPWGEQWASVQTAERLKSRGYQFDRLGAYTFKGKNEPVMVSRLVGRQSTPEARFFTGAFVGRSAEVARLAAWLEPIFQGQGAGLITIHGGPGMGKSRLVYECQQRLAQRAGEAATPQWFFCPAEEILRQSLHPFKHFLRHYFSHSPDHTAEENLALFHQVLDTVIADLQHSDVAEKAGFLVEELARSHPFLAALVDLRWEGSLYEQLEPKLRFENTLAAFKALVKGESLRRPVVLHVEDAHWLDADSRELLKLLLRNLAAYPVAVICTGRSGDDGGRIALEVDPGVKQQFMDLGELPLAAARELATQLLAGAQGHSLPISDELAAFLAEKTSGNPFFVEQLLLDFRERGLLRVEDGAWCAGQEEMAEVPATINAVLVARLDRLAAQIKAVVQTAAVLGQEFEVQVLSQMLKDDAHLPAKVKRAETEAIWSALSEVRYIFRHALLRDAAYAMQLHARLRELHRLAAGVIEQVYAADLAPHYPDLAYHYCKAEEVAHERRYVKLVAEMARAAYANTTAIAAYERLLALEPEEAQIEVLLQLGATLELVGRWSEAGTHYHHALALAEATADAAAATRSRRAIGSLLSNAGNFDRALAWLEQAQAGFEALGDPVGVSQVWAESGILFWRQGDYGRAESYLEASLKLAQAAGDRPGLALVFNHLGNVYFLQGHYKAARKQYAESLALRRELNDRRGVAGSLNNLGNIAYAQDDYATAKAYLEESLALRREMGDKWGVANSINSLAAVAHEQGDYVTARARLEESLALYRELGDRRSTALLLANVGTVVRDLGDYAAARPLLEEGLALSREIGDKEGCIHALEGLTRMELDEGHIQSARARGEETVALAREVGFKRGLAYGLSYLGYIASLEGESEKARAYLVEGLVLQQEMSDKRGIAFALIGLGSLALEKGLAADRAVLATRLAAAAGTLTEATGVVMGPFMRSLYERTAGAARRTLGETAFAAAWLEGQTLAANGASAAITYALES